MKNSKEGKTNVVNCGGFITLLQLPEIERTNIRKK